jgi:hypothetical protein
VRRVQSDRLEARLERDRQTHSSGPAACVPDLRWQWRHGGNVMAAVIYTHLDYENYKTLEQQMKAFKETTHKTEGGFYHKSIRLRLDDFILEFHGPLVGGEGHRE